MIVVPAANYSFNKTANTITFSGDFAGLETSNITLVCNLTAGNIMMYQFNKAGYGGALAADVLTLEYDTSGMNNSDELLIGVNITATGVGLTDTELRATPVPVSGTVAVTGAGDATAAKQDAGNASLSNIAGKDFATQTTLAAIKTKTDNLDTALSGIKTGTDKIITAPATEAKQDAGNTTLSNIAGKDFATQTTLAAILAELRDDVFVSSIYWEDRSSTTAVFYREERIRSQDDGTVTTVYTRLSDNTVVGSLPAGCVLVQGANDRGIEAFRYKAVGSGTGYSTGDWLSNTLIYDTDGNGTVISSTWYNLSTSANISAPSGANIQAENEAVLAAILAKIIAAPATEAKQDAGNTSLSTIAAKDFATQTTLAALLAKVIAAPATEAKQDAGNTSLSTIAAKDFATQTTLAALLAKVIAAPATEAKQDAGNTSLSTIAAKDFATQTTLAALLAKVIAAPATEAKQDTLLTAINLLAKLTDTQPVSAASLPLPTGASTETTLAAIKSKTDNLDTALSGIKTGTDKIVAAPALDATLTGGSQKTINRGAAKGATTAGDITSTAASADRQPMDVILRDASGNTVSVGGGTQYTEDAASTGAEQLTLAGAIRQDVLSASQNADGDYSTLKTNAKGETYTKDADVKSDTALLVTALNTLNASLNDLSQQKVSVNDFALIIKRFTQLLERPPYMTPVGETRIVGGSVVLPINGSLTAVTQVTNKGAGAFDQTFTYVTQTRQIFNDFRNKVIV